MLSRSADALIGLGRRYVRDAPGALGKAALAARCLNPRLRERPRRRVVRSRFGARFAVDTRDLIQRYLYMFGVWEPHMTRWLQSRLRPGDTFVDVGANIGYYSVLASGLVGDEGQVVAIEASPDFHRKLLQQVQLNQCSNVRAVNGAVSDSRKALTFVLASSANMGANSIVPYDGLAESSFEIEARPLPELLESDEIARARVIKIDVEGAEGSVVRGMVPILDKLRPDVEITVEVTPDRMAQLGDSAEELVTTMRDHGFNVYRLANDYAPESYPSALRGRPVVPVRWRGAIVEESDLIFSRIDAETLA
ncbi:FkbM family methyltransferase [Streptomyces sp. 35G-GA-8]|uniref:FkbM family methyltransferase n=1 Tax=Streptomyces sp. 35G-GA-8 TaxID=2939434 RepID=UPI00201FA33F|nr:FkbM family methyltransferase [Streptomyces sp. 35G-GA-8]MCL7379631.1 FkbM family methyltransferase [Streptomyces sp. 35G-GA-8]